MKKHIIILDDNEHIIKFLTNFLEYKNFQVSAYNCPGELQCIKENVSPCHKQNQYCADAIISDFNMPGINGIQLIDMLAAKKCSIRKIAIISGYIHEVPQLHELCRKKNIRFFQKPFNPSEIEEWLEKDQ